MINKNAAKKELFDLYYEIKGVDLFRDYVLGGGTALALQLGHRISTDIDVFTANVQDNKDILDKLNELYKTYYIISITDPVLQVTINNIKVDFIKDTSTIIEMPKTDDKITYFGIKDIAAMKLRTILTRTKSRDFIDIAYLLKNMSLDEMFDNYRQKYRQDDAAVIKIALLKSRNITHDEWKKDIYMLKNDIVLENIPGIIEKEIVKHNKKHDMGNKKNLLRVIGEKIRKTGSK